MLKRRSFLEAARCRACASRLEAARYRACASRLEAARCRACASRGAGRFDRRPRQDADIAHEGVLVKGGFHSVEIDAGAPNLDLPVLAADPLQQPVGPLAHEISRPEKSARGRAI